MKERPILFSGPMVRAIIDGRKSQTRRIVKPQECIEVMPEDSELGAVAHRDCPYGQPGDRLWVREAFTNLALPSYSECFVYRADGTHSAGDGVGCALPDGCRWKPSIHMPRRASRITLGIVEVRVERLQDISNEDALAEGVQPRCMSSPITCSPRVEFGHLWESINGRESWDTNPWVWVVEFRRVERGAGS